MSYEKYWIKTNKERCEMSINCLYLTTKTQSVVEREGIKTVGELLDKYIEHQFEGIEGVSPRIRDEISKTLDRFFEVPDYMLYLPLYEISPKGEETNCRHYLACQRIRRLAKAQGNPFDIGCNRHRCREFREYRELTDDELIDTFG